MAITEIGQNALIAREAIKLVAYRDSVGVWTIGVGHTSAAGAPVVTAGLTITRAEAMAIFARDLVQYEAAVDKAITKPMADHERDAFVSICYNIGPAGFRKSTFVKRFNAGDKAGCAVAIMRFVKPASITSRREGERDQFLTPYSVSLPAARSGEKAIKAKGPKVAAKRQWAEDLLPAYEITAIQKRLIELGYHVVGIPTGLWGTSTSAAVQKLQGQAALTDPTIAVDGHYGPQTIALLADDANRAVVSDTRADLRSKDLAKIGNPGVVSGRRIQWTSIAAFGVQAFALLSLAFQNYQQGTDSLPWAAQAVLNFLPPWASMLAPMLFALYTAAQAKGLIGASTARVQEGIDNSGLPPANPKANLPWPFNLMHKG